MIRPPILPLGPFHAMPPISLRTATKRGAAVMLILSGLTLSGLPLAGQAHAEGTPTTTPPPPAAPKPAPSFVANPAEMMAAMAHELDKNPDQGVLVLENLKITQGEMADVIRSFPVSMASMGYEAVSRRALEVLVNQKAMVLNAMKEGLDKDPSVMRRTLTLHDRAMADAWLTRKGDAGINNEALHARYDRDIAGKPGPYEVRARLILVPTEAEARIIIEKAQAGADFAELARTYSKDGSAAKGGDLGYGTQEAVSPEIGATMFALQLGQVTPFPMKSGAGYFILRVEGRRQRGTPTFEEARPQLEAELRGEGVKDAIENVMAHIKMKPVEKPTDPPKN
jgi:peptidyl-prolyl cis-trans isomerase C